MMTAVKQRAELYDEWASLVKETLEAKLEKKKGRQQARMRKQSIKGAYRGFGTLTPNKYSIRYVVLRQTLQNAISGLKMMERNS